MSVLALHHECYIPAASFPFLEVMRGCRQRNEGNMHVKKAAALMINMKYAGRKGKKKKIFFLSSHLTSSSGWCQSRLVHGIPAAVLSRGGCCNCYERGSSHKRLYL
jgi:hypothetical protein